MTLLGIAGCTMLVITGLGLNDSISGIVDKSFNEIAKYDGVVVLSKTDDLNSIFTTDSSINSFIYTSREYIDVSRDQTQEKNIQLVVPKGDVTPYVAIRNMATQQTIALQDTGVVITQKLSELLNVKVGDTIALINQDEDRYANVTITGIAENYVGHYVYMSEKSYESAFGTVAKTNSALIKINNKAENEDALAERLLSAGALNVTLTSSQVNSFDDTISSVVYVVFVLILSAAALAFVVLFSLTSINIEERIRELATIKVLGFYDREVSAYVYRENILLTMMGRAARARIWILYARIHTYDNGKRCTKVHKIYIATKLYLCFPAYDQL